MTTLPEKVEAYCHSLGFILVGAIPPVDLQYFSLYQRWIERGCQAGMHYLSGEHALYQRENPCHVMPSCQSILVLAYPYPPTTLADLEKQKFPFSIAAYAQVEDYHLFLPRLLAQIVQFMQEQTDQSFQSMIFTDSGPLLEREIATRAGLGWIGKNSCLINRRFGSNFFLSEILLDFSLVKPTALPEVSPDRCGNCQRCIEICPTHCIQSDRTLDAGRCISYLTIENKGEIPILLRSSLGNHLFGCDLCQQCCPWNQKKSSSSTMQRSPNSPENFLQEISAMDILNEVEFKKKFASSPICRAKRRGFYRNLAVVLGNQKEMSSGPILFNLLHDQDALVRQHAAWALGCMPQRSVRSELKAALQSETEQSVIQEIELALKQ